jgi:glycine/D-amino acid oxidase-like deaminating enzyme
VCIAGAGFTGLWTAYYLKQARPDLEIVIVEREFAGFGASGRNGGWISDHFLGVEPGSVDPGNGGYLVVARVTTEREGGDKAACAADTISLLVP